MPTISIRKLFKKLNDIFDLKKSSNNADMAKFMEQLKLLHFDGITDGKENLRGDCDKLRNDFMKATMEAKKRLRYEGC